MRIIVYSPWGYNESSGGIIALHKLSDNLVGLVDEAIIYTDPQGVNSKYRAKFMDNKATIPKEWDKDTVVVYPEIIDGNPLGLKYVVRWLLNTPGVVAGDENTYLKTELVYNYAPYFFAKNMANYCGQLTAFELFLDEFISRNNTRAGTCFSIRKGAKKALNWHTSLDVPIDGWESKGGRQYLVDTFNSCERFISYDHASFLSVQAALCGCLSIVVPDGITSKEEWHVKFPYFKYGIAYGEDDIEYAINTQNLVRSNLIELEKKSIEQTKKLVMDCKNLII
jgi:hypothetical protein